MIPRMEAEMMPLNKPRIRRGFLAWSLAVACSLSGAGILSAQTAAPTPAAGISKEPQPTPSGALPIDLPYALRLVNASNPTIAIARERVREAYARQQQANVLWVPNLWFGGNPDNLTLVPAFYHHDGQIQNSRGQILNTSKTEVALIAGTGLNFSIADAYFAPRVARNLTAAEQARARVVTYNVQLDVALTYLELLRVYGALAVVNEILAKAEIMLRDANTAERAGMNKTTADANRARTEVELRRKERLDWEGQAAVVSARLAQLLLLDPSVDLVPADAKVLPLVIVPEDQSLDDLLAIGLMSRPELAESRALVAAALARWRQERTRPLLPTLQMAYYGAQFGGGTPGVHNYGGRDDFLAQATWELKNGGLGNLFQARATRSQYNEANLHVTEVQAQVAAEVVAAAKLVRKRQLALHNAEEAVRQAEEMWTRLAKASFGMAVPAAKYDPLEPILAEQALHNARMQYLDSVIDYNREQFRLFWAMGQPPLSALPRATAVPVQEPVEPPPSVPGQR
ncbi:MAG TPA: TolC family protein [Gemmataceae bacterium]|nr:TolC family protein [Gemmataceae bacterium]